MQQPTQNIIAGYDLGLSPKKVAFLAPWPHLTSLKLQPAYPTNNPVQFLSDRRQLKSVGHPVEQFIQMSATIGLSLPCRSSFAGPVQQSRLVGLFDVQVQ